MIEVASFTGSSIRRLLSAALLIALLVQLGCTQTPGSAPSEGPEWDPPATELRRSVFLADRSAVPLVVVPFSRKGIATSSQALKRLDATLADGGYTDIYVICPGWHDGWYPAVQWIESFAAGHERARTWAADAAGRKGNYKPLYIGVIWPGDVFNSAYPEFNSEARRTPMRPDVDRTAMLNVLTKDVNEAEIERVIQALRDRGHDLRASRLEMLLSSADTQTPPRQIELADCLLPLFGPQDEPSAPGLRYALTVGSPPVERAVEVGRVGLIGRHETPLPPMTAVELLDVWKDSLRTASMSVKRTPAASGRADEGTAEYGLSVPELKRWALRAADLRVLNDRGYQLGKSGLRDLLKTVQSTCEGCRVHVVGHSFGAEAVLTALTPSAGATSTPVTQPATGPATEPAKIAATTAADASELRPVDSLLLLSPLVNHWALGDAPLIGSAVPPKLQSKAVPGAAHGIVAGKTARTIVVLYSTRDWFANYYAPLALRRPSFEGMASADSWSGQGKGFATMGGEGPNGLNPPAHREELIAPGAGGEGPLRYSFPENAGANVVAVDGSAVITTHGDANDRTTWWLFASQVEARR